MESRTLGLYLSKTRATVVAVQAKGHHPQVTGGFTVTVDGAAQAPWQALAKAVADGCAEHKLSFGPVAVALDCSLCMQHRVHSELTAAKQIASTVRFDTEEVIATDISKMAVAFQVVSVDPSGSNLAVFTADHAVLSDLIVALQSHGMDPVSIGPDAGCLARVTQMSHSDGEAVYAFLSSRHGYFVTARGDKQVVPVRSFMVGQAQNRTELLAREALMTTASAGGQVLQGLQVFDSTGEIQPAAISKRLSLTAHAIDWIQGDGAGPLALSQGGDPVDYAIALGAAMAPFDKTSSADFRKDFMPFQGKRMRLHGAVKWACVSATFLVLVLGLWLQVRFTKTRQSASQVKARFSQDYASVMKNSSPGADPIAELKKEISRINRLKSGVAGMQGDESVPARLSVLLKALGEVSLATGLKVESITVAEGSMTLVGKTTTSDQPEKVLQALRANGLDVSQHSVNTAPEETTFRAILKSSTRPGGVQL